MPPLRTLHVIDSLGGGGAEHSLRELLPAFAARGVVPAVAVLGERPESDIGPLVDAGIPVHRLPAGAVARVRALRRLLGEHGADVLHTTLYNSDLAGRFAAWRTGTPVVTSLVNTSYDAGRRRDPNVAAWRLAVVRSVEGWTARRLNASFHAISEAVAASAVDALGIARDRVTVVPRGRERARLGDPSPARRAEARRRLDLSPDDSVVVTVGRQEFQKGQRTLVDAMARMQQPALLLVVGRDGAATAEVREAARPLGERVRFLGHRHDVPEVLAAADLFAFPSRYEGLGGAVIEAMALGLPVVASDLPALREVVEADGTGLLVPPDDPASLAGALDRLLADDHTRRRMGDAGRQRFLDRFTLDAVVEPMIAVLADAAGTVAGRARPFRHRRPGANGA